MCIISIHQPNFFPHKPFFDKVEQSDKFIALTSAQWEKGGYQNRFQLNGKWHTMSVNKGLDSIQKKTYVSPQKDWNKIKKNLPQYINILEDLEQYIGDSLMNVNMLIIGNLSMRLDIRTAFYSDFGITGTGTERLVNICKEHGATKYLSGVSGKNYMDLSLFDKAGIEVIFQEPSPSKPILEVLYERK